MKKFNYKSRKGFTLIELLVVIGILAVLAAIAIPSVAGLIDRANVSADDTNANEMTNAIERFTSEYELFCQDIASGRFNKNDMDAAQSRVYNVTGAEDRDDIKDLESEDGLAGKKINKDTKYPENVDTTKSIVENYTKTSSATFEPKQSDMHFWYSPDCGVVVYAEPEASKTVLNGKIVSGKDAKGKTLDENTDWIDLTSSVLAVEQLAQQYFHNGNVIPEGATYQIEGGALLVAGDPFPTEIKTGDEYNFGDYIYKYNYVAYATYGNGPSGNASWRTNSSPTNSWGVKVKDRTLSTYSVLLHSIGNANVTHAEGLFAGCANLTSLASDFKIPATLVDMDAFFYGCDALETVPNGVYIPSSVKSAKSFFSHSDSLTTIPSTFYIEEGVENLDSFFRWCYTLRDIYDGFTIPSSVTNVNLFFAVCYDLETIPDSIVITDNITNMSSFFENCTSLTKIPDNFRISRNVTSCNGLFGVCSSLTSLPENFTIPGNVNDVSYMFRDCTSLKAEIYFECIPTNYESCFNNTIPKGNIKIYGSDEASLQSIALTAGKFMNQNRVTYEVI